LKEISNYYEIYVFTASMDEYASPVIDLIDKNNIIKDKFFRQDCIYNNDIYIKDLFKVTNNLKNVIIIDNNPSSYATNEDNGIPIKTWYDDLNDNELIKLIPV
jgi:Dullard-like phosphatase family protein